jgi:hypothetical protein
VGTFDGETLDATQVFVHLPDVVGPCPTMIIRCEEGAVATYERDANRCMVPTGCVKRGFCPMYMPTCGSGCALKSWSSHRPEAGSRCDGASSTSRLMNG